ncbi:MAG TPA: glycosyltransferase family 2 protein [Thermoanaerobaculia bacterium]|jgi:dolichol-phosphate mannosyltransferase|nr:glycosyltransferase family 2 protein [Thermoanaerobaculia bacterium]
MTELRISVAVPMYDEEENVAELLRRLSAVLLEIPSRHEIVAVDDGSSDRTLEFLRNTSLNGVDLVIVSFSRNFGHQSAYSAALDHATGDVIILIDGDLQDPPELIPQLVAKHREGFDVVYARRGHRDAPWHLRVLYRLFYRLMETMSDTPMPLDSGDFSLISRRVADVIRGAPERHRYLRGLRAWAGFRQVGIEVPRPARAKGTSKYTASKLLALAFDGLFSFSRIPLRVAATLGVFTVAAAMLFGLYSLFAKFVLHQSPQGFTALILTIIFVSGVQLFFLGVIGEYVGRIYTEVKARPRYVVAEVIRK